MPAPSGPLIPAIQNRRTCNPPVTLSCGAHLHSWSRTVDDVVDRALFRILHDRTLTPHCATVTTRCSTTSTRPGGAGGVGPGGVGSILFPHLQHVSRQLEASVPLDVAWQVLLGLHTSFLGDRRISRPVLDHLVMSGLLVHQTHAHVLVDLTP